MYVCMYVFAYVYMWRPQGYVEDHPSVFQSHPDLTDPLVCRYPEQLACPGAGFLVTLPGMDCLSTWHFMWLLGLQALALMLAQQTLDPLNHLPSPSSAPLNDLYFSQLLRVDFTVSNCRKNFSLVF